MAKTKEKEKKKYRFLHALGKYKKGQIVTLDTPYLRRKLRDGDCLEEVTETTETVKEAKSLGAASENKAIDAAPENKDSTTAKTETKGAK